MNDANAQDLCWIRAARAGDQAAFRQLVEAHARRVFHVCLRVTGDEAMADDAVQDCFLAVYRKLGDFAGTSRFSTWLHRIAVNAALQLVRKRKRYREDALDEEMLEQAPANQPTPDRETEGLGMQEILQAAMRELSEMERLAFTLRHFEEFSIAEISSRLGVKDSACKQAIFRAVGKMRLALAAYRETDIQEGLGGET